MTKGKKINKNHPTFFKASLEKQTYSSQKIICIFIYTCMRPITDLRLNMFRHLSQITSIISSSSVFRQTGKMRRGGEVKESARQRERERETYREGALKRKTGRKKGH